MDERTKRFAEKCQAITGGAVVKMTVKYKDRDQAEPTLVRCGSCSALVPVEAIDGYGCETPGCNY